MEVKYYFNVVEQMYRKMNGFSGLNCKKGYI